MNNQQQGGTGNCTDDIIRWWASVPIATKSIFVMVISVVILDIFGVPINKYLIDAPQLIQHFQIWRLFVAQFCDQIINAAFGLLSIYSYAVMLERQLGSIHYFIDFLFQNFLIQFFFVTSVWLIDLIFSMESKVASFGLFNSVILYLSLRCFSDPESSSNFLCFPFAMKNKYQPFAIILFFTLLGGNIRFDFLAAAIIGYVEVKFFGGIILRISPSRLAQLKSSFFFKPFSNRQDFIDSDGTLLQNQNLPVSSQPQQQSSTFAGRGVSIGGDPVPQVVQPQRQNQTQYVVNPSQNENSNDFKQFGGKGVSIGGSQPTISPQQQRDLMLKRFQQEQRDESLISGIDDQDQQNSGSELTSTSHKQPQKKDGNSSISQDLL